MNKRPPVLGPRKCMQERRSTMLAVARTSCSCCAGGALSWLMMSALAVAVPRHVRESSSLPCVPRNLGPERRAANEMATTIRNSSW